MLLNYKPKACRFKYVLTPIVVGVLLAHSSRAQESEHLSSEQLTKQTIHRRALDAAIWGQPIVSFDAMRQAYFRDAKANYNDVIWWPKGAGWKNQSLTVNTSVRYLYFFFNTRNDGPVVLELPGAIDGAGFFGTITDAWFVPLVDIGSQGEDNGKGGKYLVLPPDYKGDVPSGYIPVRPRTYNTYTLVRSIVASDSEEDVRKGDELVKQIKLYSLSKAANPPVQRFVDMTDILYEGLVSYDESLYTSLAGMLNEEPVNPRDLQMMGMLLPLGIEKGKELKPDTAMTAELKSAAREAQDWLIEGLVRTSTEGLWPDSKWVIPCPPIGVKTIFKGGRQLFRCGFARNGPRQLLRDNCQPR